MVTPNRTPAAATRLPDAPKIVQMGIGLERGFTAGVMRYFADKPDWTVFYTAIDEIRLRNPGPQTTPADAFIVGLHTLKIAAAVRACPKPLVNVYESKFSAGIPTVCVDNVAIGRLAFEHLHDRGLREFAYLPWTAGPDNHLREQGFYDAARAAGLEHKTRTLECQLSHSDWVKDIRRQSEIFRRDVRPATGLFCFADWLASLAITALHQAGLAIPDDVAIVGLGDDEHFCSVTRPPLTSIDTNQPAVGYQAAHLLRQIVAGQTPPPEPVRVAPIGAIERASTQLMACDDADVVSAIRYIERQLARGNRPGAAEVSNRVLVPRRTLDAKFTRHLGHTIAEVADRHQLQRVLQKLERSDAKIHTVAGECGFKTLSHLDRFVRRHTGKTPTEYRHWTRIGR